MPQEAIIWTANGLIIWAALVATLSVVMHWRVPWWRTEMGRHLMAYMGVMAAVLVLSVFRMFFGDAFWFSLLRLATFVGVPIVMTQRLWLQIKAQRCGHDDTAAAAPAAHPAALRDVDPTALDADDHTYRGMTECDVVADDQLLRHASWAHAPLAGPPEDYLSLRQDHEHAVWDHAREDPR